MSLEFKVVDLGKLSYAEAWEVQKDYFEKRMKGEVQDTLLLAEHDPTITFGVNKNWNVLHVAPRVLNERGIAFHDAKRGGGAAYLGPGQLIGYTIMEIKPYGGVLPFMMKLEDVMIKTAGDYEIPIEKYDVKNPRTDKPYRATWYRNGEDYVLCTKGIGVKMYKNGVYTHHGFCLNVNKNDTYYDLIDPCGFPISEVKPISIGEIKNKDIEMDDVKDKVVGNFTEVFKKNGKA
jgi:lipoyl(octanoyl) transferase